MATQVVELRGLMNTDDLIENIQPGQHILANNIRFLASSERLSATPMPGTTLIPNSLLPFGSNVCIGGKFDEVKNRIIWANYNSNGNHSIFLLDLNTSLINYLILENTNTAGGVTGFDLSRLLVNWDIVYGDGTIGDILYFLDTLQRPSKINIDRALVGGYGLIQRTFLNVIKEPPDIQPRVCYDNDVSVTVNNLRKRLFIFTYRFIFDDKEKSVWSTWSECPLPLNPFDQTVDSDPTKNCVIPIIIQTGRNNVKKIEIAGALSLGSTFSNLFSIVTLDKTALGISDNDTYTYKFYNERGYVLVDPTEALLEYDFIPKKANAQTLLVGANLAYGATTEGYPNVSQLSNGVTPTSATSGQSALLRTNAFSTFLVTQAGYTAGNPTNIVTIHAVLYGTIFNGDGFVINAGGVTISYTAVSGDTPASVMSGLGTIAAAAGFTVVGSDSNNLYFFKTGVALTNFYFQASSTTSQNTSTNSVSTFDWLERRSFGLQYFDQSGRQVGGVITVPAMSVQTISYNETGGLNLLPYITVQVNHRPPLGAYWYNVVRTKSLSQNGFIYWVTDRTYKDVAPAPDGKNYAYISIANLNSFVTSNPGSPLGYSFLANDRIRFIKLYNIDGTTNTVYNNLDFEIVASVNSPTINGVAYTGQFIKIVLPPASMINATFDFGSSNFNYYLIKLYTPSKPLDPGLNVYYECSKRYAIVNPGTATAAHEGDRGLQSNDLLTPATLILNTGDYYLRTRGINIGAIYAYQITTAQINSDAGRYTVGAQYQSSTYNNPNILTGSSITQNLVGFDVGSDDSRWLLKVISGTYTFQISGTITIQFIGDIYNAIFVPTIMHQFILQRNDYTVYAITPSFESVHGGTFTFQINATFTLGPGQKIFILGLSTPDIKHSRVFTQTNLNITLQQNFSQTVIDPNFSDYFQSSVNSNARPWAVDVDAGEVYYRDQLRWGDAFEPSTNINKISRFYPQNFDIVDREKGDIQRLHVLGKLLHVYQNRGVGRIGIYGKYITDALGNNQLSTTSNIISPNNIQYYVGRYGMGSHPESLVIAKNQAYFVDPIRGYQIRLSDDGLIPISELYKGRILIRSLFTPYNKTWNRPDGSFAKIMGAYNFLDEEYYAILQSGTSGTQSIADNAFGFNEQRNAYTSFYDFHPEFILSANENIYSWLNGQIYVHNNTAQYCNYYGVQYTPSLDIPFIKEFLEKKSWLSISEVASGIWDCPLIYTNTNSYDGQRQESNLVISDFVNLESNFHANLLRDKWSQNGLVNGDTLKGQYLVARFQNSKNPSAYVTLSQVAASYIESAFFNK